MEGRKVTHPDGEIAAIAARQHGVVSIGQLRRLGLTEKTIRGRVTIGRLHRVHRGVYAVGHTRLSVEGRCMGAVLAAGRGPHGNSGTVFAVWRAAVSHRSAALLWGMLRDEPGPCDVIVGRNAGKAKRTGIRIHRSLSLSAADVTLRDGIPVTKPARTIADLRLAVAARFPGAPSPRELRRAIRQANVLGLPLDGGDAKDRTRGDLEGAFLALCRRNRLPRPEVNVRVGPHLVDFLWRERLLAVETDHYLHHRGRQAFQDDRGRDLDLKRRGFEVIRLSERQLDDDPDLVAEVLRGALAG